MARRSSSRSSFRGSRRCRSGCRRRPPSDHAPRHLLPRGRRGSSPRCSGPSPASRRLRHLSRPRRPSHRVRRPRARLPRCREPSLGCWGPPGEFTLLFHDRKPGVAAAPPGEQGPRDYLQALNTPAAPRDAPTPFHPSPPSAPAPAAPPTAAKEPGDFTRLMAGISAPPSPPQAGSAGGSVGVTGAPGGPSDFTRIVAGLPAPPSQPPAQQPAEAAPQPRSSRLFVLLLALGLIGAAAAFLVLYFALKP